MFLLLSQKLATFLLEDQIVNILDLWVLWSLHMKSWKHPLKICKWVGMVKLCYNKTLYAKTGSQPTGCSFPTPSPGSWYSSVISWLDLLIILHLSSLLDCRPWEQGILFFFFFSFILICPADSITASRYSQSTSAEALNEMSTHINLGN